MRRIQPIVLTCTLAALPAWAAAQTPAVTAGLDRAMALAEEQLRIGERQTAESHYRTALLHGWMLLGMLRVAAADMDGARLAFTRASTSAVENRDALQALAIVTLELGDAAEAVAILTRLTTAAPRDVPLRLSLAQALVALKRPEEAAQELDVAQTLAPKDPEVAFALASGYLRLKKVAAAEQLFEKVAAAHPRAESYVLIGRTYRDFHYFDRARAAFRRALTMNPRVARAHYYLGTTALLEEGVVVLDEAIAEFRKELAISPGDPLATLRLGVVLVEGRQHAEAMPLLERAVRGPSPSYDAWMYLGRCQLALGRAADAVQSFRRALATAEKTGQQIRRRSIHYQLALALRDSGATADADREFAEAQRLSVEQAETEREQLTRFLADTPSPSGPDARALLPGLAAVSALTPEQRGQITAQASAALTRSYLNLGIVHAQASRFPRAAELFALSAEVDPAFPQVQYSLGVAYFNAQQYAKAVPALLKALEQQPQNADARRMLALACLNTEDYARAADLLRTDPKLPSDPSLQYAFGLALVRSGRTDEAERIFTRVLAEHPDVPELNVVIGQIHAAQGDFDAAVSTLQRAIAIKRDVPEAHATLGDIYLRQGKFADAANALRTELGAYPGNIPARNTLANALELDGKSDEAVKELRTILAVRPDYAHARYLLGKILIARGAADEALVHLEAAVKAAPQDANIHYQLGQAYQRLGRAEQAAKAFETYQRLKDQARGGKL